jgi:hypothetical protein
VNACLSKIVRRLQAQPHFWGAAESQGESDRHLWRNRRSAIDTWVDIEQDRAAEQYVIQKNHGGSTGFHVVGNRTYVPSIT